MGFSVQIAQYLGAGREKDSRNVLCQAIVFNLLFGIALAVLATVLGQFLPALLGAEESFRPHALAYFCTVAMFLSFSMASAMYSAISRCSGNVLIPSLMNVGMCVLYVIFNALLIYPTRRIGGVTVWGAGRADMAERFAKLTTAFGFAFVVVTSVLLFACAPELTRLLMSEAEVVALSSHVLRIVAFAELLFAVSIVVIGALRGAGDGKGPFWISTASMRGIRVATVLLFTQSFGVVGVWVTMAVELSLRGIFFLVRLLRGQWIKTAALE